MNAHMRRIEASVALLAAGFALAWFLLPWQRGHAQTAQTEKLLVSGLVRDEDTVPTRGPWGEWHRYFRGMTYGTKDMVVLAVTLKPGHEPHPPHEHAEEEFMILTDGSGKWTVDGKEFPAKKGDVVYAAPWTTHGIKHTGDAPLTYYMVKWNNKGVAMPERPARNGR